MSRPATAVEPLLRVQGLVKHYPTNEGGILRRRTAALKAVDGVSFDIHRGETLGLVGESGCGKSTIARTILGFERPTGGSVAFDGIDLFALSKEAMRQLRRRIQIVFQDPYASLSPRHRVEDIVAEPWTAHGFAYSRSERHRRACELLERVGLQAGDAKRYPHEFSGGQRQRIGIARALALEPELILCDEPVSALDVSVQAQVLTLLQELQRDLGVAYLFIGHDLAVVRHISHRVAVMYLGKVIEIGAEADVLERPAHPYTQALLSAAPVPDPDLASARERIILHGEIPSPVDPPSGCAFRTRCWKAQERCAEEQPALIDRFGHGHPSACHYAGTLDEATR